MVTVAGSGEFVGQTVTVEPETDPDTAWWWEALERGDLLVPMCGACGGHFFPPMPTCPFCGARDVQRVPASGEGSVYSWIVIHRPADPAFTDEAPYAVVAVHLKEGARMFGRIANGPLHDGMPVRAVPYRVGDTTLLGFERATEAAHGT